MLMTKSLIGGAGLAALAAAAPSTAQYYPYRPMGTQYAAQRCTAAVQARLNNRVSLREILGAAFGNANYGRVLSVTRVDPRRNTVRVRGLATSGRYAYNRYGPYGVGAYGALGYGYQPDLSFRCDVDYRGRIRDVDINRR